RVYLTSEQHSNYPEISNRYITEIFEVGLEYMINILEIALLDTIFVFRFDNSSSHSAFAEDVLVASRINVKYG
ncbi:21149_t:CDS:2, partial [Racocetra persica]